MTPSSTFITFHYEKTSAAFCMFLTHPIAWDFYSILLNVENFFMQASGSFYLRLAPAAGGLVGGERGQSRRSAGPRAYVTLGGVMGASQGLLAMVMFLRGDVFAVEHLRGSDSRVRVEQSIEQMSLPVLDVEGSQMLLAEEEEQAGSSPTPASSLSATEIGEAARPRWGSVKAPTTEIGVASAPLEDVAEDAPTSADVTSPSTPRRPLHQDGARSQDQHDAIAAHAISENEIVSVLQRAAGNNDPGVEKLLAEFGQVQADHESPEQLKRWRAHVAAFLETTGVEKQAEVRGRDATVESSSVSN